MAERADNQPSFSDDPFDETVATTGLFLIIAAIVALAVAMASWVSGETLIAWVAGAAALVSFAASIACFTSDATEDAVTQPAT